MLALKGVLVANGISQAELARAIGVSPAAIAQLLNHEVWPTNPPRDALQASITVALAAKEIAVEAAHFEPAPITEAPIAEKKAPEGIDMLLRKQGLTQQARKHFAIFRDPFDNDVTEPDDVFMSTDIRYVREAMWSTAKNGGFIAISGESGSGKTTLRRDLNDRIEREGAAIMVVEPYVLGMEDNDRTGKTLKAASIADAMINRIAPLDKPRSSMEAKSRQLHNLLRESKRAGNAHCLVIEEAHALSVPTLKHLKRFFELEDGFKKLVSIILIGQTELGKKLGETKADVREVVQRCELIQMAPLDSQLEPYLRFKFGRIDKALDDVFDQGALDAIRSRLIFTDGTRERRVTTSLMYPLMINNLVTIAMNQAAMLGFDRVTADLVKEL